MKIFSKLIISILILALGSSTLYLCYECSQILPQNTTPSNSKHPKAALDLLQLNLSNDTSYSGRILLQRNSAEKFSLIQQNWQLNYAIATIWTYLNWNKDEILNTILDESLFGQEWQGINLASKHFFGVEVSFLTTEELAVLIVNLKSNSLYNPWCNRENVEVAASILLREYNENKSYSYSQTMLERLQQHNLKCSQK